MLAIVLAGGENRRLPVTKSFINIGGRRLIEGLLSTLGGFFDRLAISTNEPEKYFYLGVPLIGDVYPVRGPMTGIFSALSFYSAGGPGSAGGAEHDAFFIACDMPFVNMGLVAGLAGMREKKSRPGYDAIVPMWKGRPEPLFAFYSSACLPMMEKKLAAGQTGLREFLADKKTCTSYLDEKKVREVDPEGFSFININTGEDLEAATAVAEAARAGAGKGQRAGD